MGYAFDASEIELVIKHLQVDYRPIERIAVTGATQIALHLFSVVTLWKLLSTSANRAT